MSKSEDKAYQLLENMVIKNSQWLSERVTLKKPAGMFDIDVFSNLAARVSLLTKQLRANQLQSTQATLTWFKLVLPCVNFSIAPIQVWNAKLEIHLVK